MIRDQQYDPNKQYVARRKFTMLGVEYSVGDPVPVSCARDGDHHRKLYTSRLIYPAREPSRTEEEVQAADEALAQAKADLEAARARKAAGMNGAHVELVRERTPPEFEWDNPKPQEAPGQAESIPAVITGDEASPPAGEPQGEAELPSKVKVEVLPGGTTTRFIEIGGRGWFTIHWDGTEQKVRGADAARTVFDNLQAQDNLQKGVTQLGATETVTVGVGGAGRVVFAGDAPDGAGGEDDVATPSVDGAVLGDFHRPQWIEGGRDQTDLP